MSSILFFCVSFFASIAGAICGIGGGVIIKPVLDMLGLASVATISFLSGCTVLSMSCYTVGKNIAAGDNRVDFRTGTPLAIGAAVGGVVGKQLFSTIAGMFPNPNTVGVVQSICLAIITIGTFVYTLFKARIQGKHITNPAFCVIIGLVLGLMSSFLGIGGGPINLVVLFYFFSMETKTAEQSVHHSVQPDHQPADHPYHPQRAGIHPARPGFDDCRRHRRWHCRPHAEQADEQPCRGQAVPGIDGHYYFDQHLQCSALYGRLRFVGRQEGGVISIRN